MIPATGMARAFRNGMTLDDWPKIGGSRPSLRFWSIFFHFFQKSKTPWRGPLLRYLDPLKRILGYVYWSLRHSHEKIGGSEIGLHKYKIIAHSSIQCLIACLALQSCSIECETEPTLNMAYILMSKYNICTVPLSFLLCSGVSSLIMSTKLSGQIHLRQWSDR